MNTTAYRLLRPLWVIVGLVASASGCGDAAPESASPPQVRDSAGVRWVVNQEPPRGGTTEWQVSSDPILRIGAVDGDTAYLFGGIRGVTRLSDGTVVVLDAMSHQLRAYSPRGSHVWTAGGRGAGPGELQAPRGLQSLPGDVLQIEDGGHDRPLTRIRYSAEGELIEHDAVDWGLLQRSGSYTLECRVVPRFVEDALILPESSCLIDATERVTQPGATRVVAALSRLGWGLDEAAESLGSFLRKTVWVHSVRGWPFVVSMPLSPRGVFAVGGNPARLAYASTNRYRIDVYDVAEARHALRIERPGQNRPPTDHELAEAWAEWDRELERARDMSERVYGSRHKLAAELTRAKGSFPVPDSIAPIEGLVIDRLGHIWVQHRAGERSEMQTWAVYGEDGMLLSDVDMPSDIRIFEIGEDYVLGVTTDEYHLQYVTVLGLDRAGP